MASTRSLTKIKDLLMIEDSKPYKGENNETIWRLNGPNGVIHRKFGPAVIHENGDCEWILNGQLHRKNGPAIVFKGTGNFYYDKGKHHRIDGPAVDSEVAKEYWINGIRFTESDYLDKIIKMKINKK
jgi:hypothetical protein